ncbi:PREDICTED: adherens junction-associated protein 1 [Calidris pugnax]|uniref:adherens junction-associated protein 1 n=1 Tax=Calidris pugnax TaxID=198806 RepID=UPI00071D9F0F|nr:PREDICTED: adherens junction-associated protein 1 [Calidris pugnax]
MSYQLRSGCPLGSHAWILIAMFHLAMDLASCQPPTNGAGGRLSPRPALRHRLSRGALWGTGSGDELRRPGPPWTCTPAPPQQRPRSRRRLHVSSAALNGVVRSLVHGEFGIVLGGRGEVMGGVCAWSGGSVRGRGGFTHHCPTSPVAPVPTFSHFFSPTGLAVHQIITITVSLIMVIAALITTLVLKNCCAQSGRPRRNSHQRKLDQQEESCQNLTDFAPARVPSALDIFTAYNETLQCSHECVRTPVPVYAEEALHSPGDYKTTFNGNRPSSSDRHLIPVAFVSEKWFEISC